MICQKCKKNKAEWDEYYGWLPCKECQKNQRKLARPDRQVEFTTEDIKLQRKSNADDIIQPFRKGVLSKEYVQKHGTKRLKVTKEEVRKAKNVWNDLKYYDN